MGGAVLEVGGSRVLLGARRRGRRPGSPARRGAAAVRLSPAYGSSRTSAGSSPSRSRPVGRHTSRAPGRDPSRRSSRRPGRERRPSAPRPAARSERSWPLRFATDAPRGSRSRGRDRSHGFRTRRESEYVGSARRVDERGGGEVRRRRVPFPWLSLRGLPLVSSCAGRPASLARDHAAHALAQRLETEPRNSE